MYEPRYYQSESVEAAWDYLRNHQGNPAIVLPTGAGKSIVIAQMCKDVIGWGGRVLVMIHTRELVEQNAEKIKTLCPDSEVGVYCSGLNKRDTKGDVIVASIQSVYKRAEELSLFNIVLIDECDLISTKGQGMYDSMIRDIREVNPKMRLIGLTASPFRLDGGYICKTDNILNEVCYEVGVKELIDKEFLCPIVSKASIHEMDADKLTMKYGEYVDAEMEEDLSSDESVERAVNEIISYGGERKCVLIFCITVKHAELVKEEIESRNEGRCAIITGTTDSKERDLLLKEYKEGTIKFMVNVNVLSVGFDNPRIDMICLLKATASARLFYQMVGRGLRMHESKENCLILDYGQNVLRLGTVDNLQIKEKSTKKTDKGQAPAKMCERCRAMLPIGYTTCPDCHWEFPVMEEVSHGTVSSLEDFVSSDKVDVSMFEVSECFISIHKKSKPDGGISRSLKIEYRIEGNSSVRSISEWVCIEHTGFAGRKAQEWWEEVSEDALGDRPTIEIFMDEYKDVVHVPKFIACKKKEGSKYWSVEERKYDF